MTELLTTIVRVTVHHRKPIDKLADAVSSRAWSIDGVESTEGEIEAASTPQVDQAAPQMLITLRQAEALVRFFGGHDTEIAVAGNLPNQTAGLYAWCTDCPEEGVEYLGPTEVDDELAMNGRPVAGQAVTLTDEQVFANDTIMALNGRLQQPMDMLMLFVRAVERAHGITQGENGGAA